MKRKSINNSFILLGLDDIVLNKMAMALSDDSDMFYLNVNDLIDYSIMDKILMKKTCGIDYYNIQEDSVIQSLSDYENTIMVLGYNLFPRHMKKLNNFFKIYIRIELSTIKKKIEQNAKNKADLELSFLAFEERDEILIKNSDVVIEVGRINKQLLNSIKKIMEGKV